MNESIIIEIELTGFGNELGLWQGKRRFQKWLRLLPVCIPGKTVVLLTRIENEGIKRIVGVQLEMNLIQLDV